MSKKYRNLWVFGDSYSTPEVCVDPKDSFWGLTATEIKINSIVNCSRASNSFNTVQQLLVGLNKEINWRDDLIFVGIPPLERITIFDDYKNTEYRGHRFDTNTWTAKQFDISAHRGLVCLQNYGTDKQLILHSDRSWLETDVLRQLFLLTQWLDSLGANYLILNLSKDFDKNNRWGPNEFVLEYSINHPRMILFENTYHGINNGINQPVDFDQYGWNGHHGPIGNKYYFENSILTRLKECELI